MRTIGVRAAGVLVGVVAIAGGSAVAQEPVEVEIAKHGTLVDGGQAALVRVTVSCAPALGDVLEAHVDLQQRRTSGQGGIPGVVCDGTSRTYTARVTAFDGPFRPGAAHAGAFVLVCDADFDCTQGQESRRVVLHRNAQHGR